MSAEHGAHSTPPKRRATEAAAPASAAVVRPVPAATLLELAGRIGVDSELVDAGRLVAKRRDNVLGLLLRALSREEVAVMEDRGCRADDWSQVQVAEDSTPSACAARISRVAACSAASAARPKWCTASSSRAGSTTAP
jgi:hypothetical protein